MNQDYVADLDAALEEADRRTLAAVLTHLTGQPDLIVDAAASPTSRSSCK